MIIRTKVFYGREDDHWFAIDLDFDIASMGATEDEALASLYDMLGSYLNSCAMEGMPYDATRRPVPLALRAKLHGKALLSKPVSKVLRSATTHESELLMPPMAAARC